MVTLPDVCNHFATAMQVKATQLVAMQFQAMQSQAETKVVVETNICPRTPQQAGAKANADSSKSPSETRRGPSIQAQVQPKCNTSAQQAAWLCKCNAGVNTSATQVQMQWKPADTCKPVYTQCKRKYQHKCNRRDNPQMQVQVQALENSLQTCYRFCL